MGKKNMHMNERILKKQDLAKLYRRFSKFKYNKYSHQNPRMRQSQLVSKIIKQWQAMSNESKKQLYDTYTTQGLFENQQIQEQSSQEEKQQRYKQQFIPTRKSDYKSGVRFFNCQSESQLSAGSDFQRNAAKKDFQISQSEEIGSKPTCNTDTNGMTQKLKYKIQPYLINKKKYSSNLSTLYQNLHKFTQKQLLGKTLLQIRKIYPKAQIFDGQQFIQQCAQFEQPAHIIDNFAELVNNRSDFKKTILVDQQQPNNKKQQRKHRQRKRFNDRLLRQNYPMFFKIQRQKLQEKHPKWTQGQIIDSIKLQWKHIICYGRNILLRMIKKSRNIKKQTKSPCGKKITSLKTHIVECQQCLTSNIIQFKECQHQKRVIVTRFKNKRHQTRRRNDNVLENHFFNKKIYINACLCQIKRQCCPSQRPSLQGKMAKSIKKGNLTKQSKKQRRKITLEKARKIKQEKHTNIK